jgi:hypothetical protein
VPTNITRGNSAQFNFRFTDTSGNTVSPTSGSITLNYAIGGVATSQTLTLALSGAFWTATWSSAGVDLGPVPWSVASSVTTNPALIGALRVIDP